MLKLLRALLLIIALFVSSNLFAQYFSVNNNYITAGNDSLEFKFQQWDGELYSFYDRKKNIEFIKEKNTHWSLYHMLVQINGSSVVAGGFLSSTFTFDTLTKPGNILQLNFHWANFYHNGVVNIGTHITIEIPANSATTNWQMSMTNPDNYKIDKIAFPSFAGIGPLSADSSKDCIAYPKFNGMLVRNPMNTLRLNQGMGWDNDYPTSSNNMQFMTYYSTVSNSGLYVSCDDSAGHRKHFNFNRIGPNNLSGVIYHTPIQTASSIVLPYKVQVGLLNGGWYEAAAKYKASVQGKPWLSKGKLSQRNDIPDWFKNSAYHSWFYTHPPAAPTANPFSLVQTISAELANYFKVPGIIDWVGFENGGWYIKYPDIFPPNEGWAAFRSAMAGIHATGNHVMSVSNTNSYSTQAPGLSAALPYIVKTESGGYLPPANYSEGSATAHLYTMCPGTTFWQNKIAKLADTLFEESMDIIQIDGFPLVSPVCYDASHGHPVGGSNWWFTAYNNLYKTIRDKAKLKASKPGFSTEAMSEAFIANFDAFWDPYSTGISPCDMAVDNCSNIEFIPLFQTVYHDHIIMQAGISFYTPPAGQTEYYRRGFGLALVWGEVPTTFTSFTNMNNNPSAPLLTYLKQIVLARSAFAKEFLVYGEMQKALELAVPQFTIPATTQIPYTHGNYPAFTSPSILTSSWKSETGTAGHIFTNISNNAVAFNTTIPNYSSGSTPVNLIYILSGQFSVLARNATLPATLNLNLPVNGIGIVKVLPASGSYVWTGDYSTDWNHPANWNSGIVPTIEDDVIIPAGTTYSAIVSGGVTVFCKTATVNQGAKLEVKAGSKLVVAH